MSGKNKKFEIPLISFDKDLSHKITEGIEQCEPRNRIKLCALYYQHRLKLQLDKQLHDELLKLKKQHEKKTNDLIRQKSDVIRQNGTFVADEYQQQLSLLKPGTDLHRPLPYQVIRHYWHTALKNCPFLKYNYTNKDGEIAKSIIAMEIFNQDTKDQKSFQISLTLSQDQIYFTNPLIQVSFYFLDSINPYRVESNAEFKSKGKKESQQQSGIFITLLQNVNLEEALNKISEAGDMCSRLGKSYEIAQIFKEELIPYSLEYFCGARNPEIKKDIMIQQQINKMNEKKTNKTKAKVQEKQEEEEDVQYPEFIEDAECKQQ